MKNCVVCRLALNGDGFLYILPLNGDKITLCFYSALEEYKVGLIQKDNIASFEMECKHEMQYFEVKGCRTVAVQQPFIVISELNILIQFNAYTKMHLSRGQV